MAGQWTPEQLEGFHEAAESLKLYRRADLHDPEDGSSLIADLYVDPLPHEQALRTVLRPNTTFIIGRKGTGKSTLFQRLQYEVRQEQTQTSAYIDIKTLFESSQVDPALFAKLADTKEAMPPKELERTLLFREFLRSVITEIKSELRKRVEGSRWERIKQYFVGSTAELFEGLDAILEDADDAQFISVLGVKTVARHTAASEKTAESMGDKLGVEVSKKPKLSYTAEDKASTESTVKDQSVYSDVLVHSFNIKNFITRLKDVLTRLKIRTLFVLVDDFSELPPDAMKVVVDVLLAPLNNWSDEFVKFKIAAYPGRVYYGAIDKQKCDDLYLDLYDLYGSGDVTKMEDSAIDFTKRLVERRLKHYCKSDAVAFFETESNELWRLLFYATMANPRNLGWLLTYLHESNLIAGRKIGARAIGDAARRYYDEKVASYFKLGKFLHEDFRERSSIYSLKELLERVVARSKELRSHKSAVMAKIHGRPPTSHFHILDQFESLLSTLELNFFVTRYFHMSDRDGRKVMIYALNYGLCQRYTIGFGRPTGEREFRLYFVERIFDYTPILQSYLAENQEIACDSCSALFPFERLEALKLYAMKCPECGNGICHISNLSKKYAQELEQVNAELLLPQTELGILQTLYTERQALRATTIAGELDCSYQLVGKRGKNLFERGLVNRAENDEGKRTFEITRQAEETYFPEAAADPLDVPE
jgi:predicted ATPase